MGAVRETEPLYEGSQGTVLFAQDYLPIVGKVVNPAWHRGVVVQRFPIPLEMEFWLMSRWG